MPLAGRPTLQTLAVILVVFALQQVVGLAGVVERFLFVLDPGVVVRPWTLLTSVYAHAHLGHLASNVIALALLGPLVARRTTTLRFHLFFVTTGAVAGLGEVVLGSLVGPPTGVVGASGAIFGLLGYLIAGNLLTTGILRRVDLSRRARIGLLVGVAVLITVATGSPRAALIGHGIGLLCGLSAGRVRLLDVTARSVNAAAQ